MSMFTDADLAPERSHADEILARYEEVDAKLVASGFPPTSPWWRESIERFYGSGTRQFVARVGRRGGKSSTVSRVAVVEGLYGQHDIPPGDVGTVAIVSTRRDEATNRLRTVRSILDALGVNYRPIDHGVELVDRPIAFKVFAASIAGVSGFTGVFVLCDEVAKWKDNETGVNPATEVIASIKPTIATQRNASIWLISSPYGTWDAHYDAFEAGNNSDQCVGHAATWEANPTVTEAETRALESDEGRWQREYAAVPTAEAESSLLSSSVLDNRLPELVRAEPGYTYVATTDPATRGNAWTFVIATLDRDNAIRIVMSREWRGSPSAPLDPDTVAIEQAGLLALFGLKTVYGDQWAADALRASYRRAGVTYIDEPWTHRSRVDAYENLAAVANGSRLVLTMSDQLREDLLSIHKVLTRSGESYLLTERGGRHADYAPSVAMVLPKCRVAPKSVPRSSDPFKARALKRDSQTRKPVPITHRKRVASR